MSIFGGLTRKKAKHITAGHSKRIKHVHKKSMFTTLKGCTKRRGRRR